MPRNKGGSKPAEEEMLLFLDFDGVLHPFSRLPDRPATESEPFVYLPRLESVLREHPHVRIVIASDWRKHHTLAELQRFFSEDIHFRIVGVIDIDATDLERGNRQRLVERYLTDQGLQDTAWLALDDDADNYLPGAALVLCNDGFRDEEERALRIVLMRERVLAAALQISGDHDEARVWCHEHRITELDSKTAEQLVFEEQGEQVLKYIDLLSMGSAGRRS